MLWALRWTVNVAEASSFPVSSLIETAGLNYTFEKQNFFSCPKFLIATPSCEVHNITYNDQLS